ncbi:MAG: biofilm PGA synthesis N-glycosyltransferase PgaC [Polaribacter sp.]|jgi:biofilm PGA synthesis N-glycosyltransferase PgaC
MIWLLFFLFVCYAVLITSLAIGFVKMTEFKPEKTVAKTRFSVIIPFRNEAENLPQLLKSIRELAYPKALVEFILVNDNSTDSSVKTVKEVLDTIVPKNKISLTNIHIINNIRSSNSPKKDAILTAISVAKNNWVLTTDADCVLPKKWLLTLDNFIQKNKPEMVVAPVNYTVKNSFLEQFQLLDFMSLQGTTIGGFGIDFPFLCNGANLAYKKETFLKLNGFEGNNTIASGDDIFLFEKFLAADKKGVQFLKSKDAMVSTFPVKTMSDLIQQRVRWASKTSNIKSFVVKGIGILVFLTNLSVIFSLFLLHNIWTLLLPLLLKIIIDLFLFVPTMRFYNPKKSFLKWVVCSSILYPFFSVLVVVKSLFSTYNWKGRKFKK